ncbi:sensor histidine kinase [Acidaminobacter sp. JC074]|uniref:cache domain-containing sensor histidine kinase n=1 Tax=Acidaminobacter sp. JC074 TaxID=2530199 RepID=UPI001F0E8547|nr:sensor histidine kinase [Acidaminobacter sp. JC074]MCH4888569.1 sensor histidine kinase [Acidaminobacter sp. JC074]
MIKRIKENFRISSLRFILSLAFAVIAVSAMMFVGVALSNEFNKTLVKNTTENSEEILEQVKINLDNYLYNMIDLSDLLTIKMSGKTDFDPKTLDSVIESTIGTRRDVITIALFDDEGHQMSSIDDKVMQDQSVITSQEWFEKIKVDRHYLHISEPHVQQLYVGEYPWVLSVSRKVTYRQGGEFRDGILLIDMNFSVIEDLLESVNLADQGYVFIVDETDNLVYHTQQQLIYAGIKEENLEGVSEAYNESFLQKDEERYLTTKVLNNVNWKLVGVYFVSDIADSQESIRNYIQIVILTGVVIFVFFSFFMSSRITQPIKELEASMEVVQEGNFDIQLETKGEYELVQLTKSYNVMIRKIRNLMDQVVIEQEAKRKSELSSLQAQINPHFLYNTLDSIVWMAEHEKHEDVILMTSSLASLFRISISKGQMIIPVSKEIDHAKHYLTIQKMRYKDKFSFEFEIDQEIYKYEVLKLILQPIIENAIYHGIRHMVDEGQIIIRGYLKDDYLYFEVEDDGLGMTDSVLQSVLYEKSDEQGVGLNNVHERIQLMYGKTYGLEIESEIEEGTKIIFKLPRNEVKS